MKFLSTFAASVLALFGGMLLIAGPVTADKLYKWTDKDGNVHYTDQAPPNQAKEWERKAFGNKPDEIPLPYSLRQAVKNFPVTLYNADCGEACTKASAFLTQRGVPFTEKNPRDPAVGEELETLTGGKLEVPVMKLGSQVIRGFEEGSWKTALDAAAYPSSSVLPVSATTATPKPAPAASQPETPTAIKAPSQGAPTGRGATLQY